MSEAEERLRAKGEAFLRQRYPHARIIHELKLNGGETRIDLAAVMPNRIVLAEVKSERDVLDRLGRQLADALQVTGSVYAFIAGKHGDKLAAACNYGDAYDRQLTVSLYRVGVFLDDGDRLTPRGHDDVDRMGLAHLPNTRALLDLLWAAELKALLTHHSLSFTPRATMQFTMRVALDNLTGRQIRDGVCRALMGRPFARADAKTERAEP